MGVKFIDMHREYRVFSSLRSGCLEVEGAGKNGRVSPFREPVLSCAHYFPAPATKAIYSVK